MLRCATRMTSWLSATACLVSLSVTVPVAHAQTPVKIGIPGTFEPYSAAVPFGIKLGLFKDEGVQPEFVAVRGSAVLLPQLANKTIDLGLPGPDLLVVALDKGEPFPVKLFYNQLPIYPFEFVVLQNSPLRTLSDLKGRKLGVGALTWGNLPVSRAVLDSVGLRWGTDVQPVPVGLGPAAWQRLKSGDVDAFNLTVGEHETMIAAGIALRRLAMPAAFNGLFSNGLATHNDTLKNRPQLAVAVARAYAKSYYACEQNLEACVRAFWEFSPASRPPADQEKAWVERMMRMNRLDIEAARTHQREGRYGEYNEDSWRQFIGVLNKAEQIKQPALPLDKLVDMSLADAINTWDRAAVRRKALAP
jgi:NitT/TauT family transport system substrate-binding protein